MPSKTVHTAPVSALNYSVHRDPAIGLGSTLLAVTIPETLLSYGGKFVFAILTAIATSLVSALIGNALRKR